MIEISDLAGLPIGLRQCPSTQNYHPPLGPGPCRQKTANPKCFPLRAKTRSTESPIPKECRRANFSVRITASGSVSSRNNSCGVGSTLSSLVLTKRYCRMVVSSNASIPKTCNIGPRVFSPAGLIGPRASIAYVSITGRYTSELAQPKSVSAIAFRQIGQRCRESSGRSPADRINGCTERIGHAPVRHADSDHHGHAQRDPEQDNCRAAFFPHHGPQNELPKSVR